MTLGVATHPSAPRHDGAGNVLNLRLPGGLDAAADARQALEGMRPGLEQPTLETLRLLVTELIANSVKHAHARNVGMKVAVGDHAVLVEVSNVGPGFEPVARYEGQDDTSGWGLFLVEQLASRWGVARDGGATKVWFELARAA